jgi:hypothetical protein
VLVADRLLAVAKNGLVGMMMADILLLAAIMSPSVLLQWLAHRNSPQ